MPLIRFFWVLLLGSVLPSVVWGQTAPPSRTAFVLQQYRPIQDPLGILQTQSAQTLGQWKFFAGFSLHYSKDPLFLVAEATKQEQPVMGYQVGADLSAALGVLPWLDVGLVFPLTLYQEGQIPPFEALGSAAGRDLTGLSPGDLQVRVKAQFLKAARFGLDLGLQVNVGFPTGNEATFNGEEGITFSALLLLGVPFRLGSRTWEWILNFGYRYQPDTDFLGLVVGHELVYGLGTRFAILPRRLDLLADLNGVIGLSGGASVDRSPMGVQVGLRLYPLSTTSLAFQAGAGFGLLGGYGSPRFRFLFGMVWSSRGPEESEASFVDSDGDGVADAADRCPKEPGPAENRGCPWPDEDGDGVADKDDRCPKVAGSPDNQGCPLATARRGSDKKDSEPDLRLDTEEPKRVQPPERREPPEARVEARSEPPKAKVVADRDGDGIPDRRDRCPDLPGSRRYRGCPRQVLVRLRKKKLSLKYGIDFKGKRLKPRSLRVLKQLAAFLKSRSTMTLKITSLTRSRSTKAWVLKLSESRVEAVKSALTEAGVEENRLQTEAKKKRWGRSRTTTSIQIQIASF